jgi:hypothetical protein
MQFSPPSCHSIHLWSKYSPQHPICKHPQFLFLSYCQRPCFTPIRTTGKLIILYILTFTFFDNRREDRRFWTEW